ncbi:hypothetical protein [Nocardia asteroides]|uniref:hypothetical protein n=1 Tax=Nocardia asteroides TaxID=1824 RepID=UPI003402FD58
MAELSQAAVTDQISQEAMNGSKWPGLGGGLVGLVLSLIAGAIGAILGGFASVVDAIFNTADNAYVAGLPIINDHTQSLADLTEAVEQLILQGNALVYFDNDEYTPNPNVVAVEVILIGAGGGGSSGSHDALISGTRSGGGGGGGGETHVTIPASLLPTNPDGSYKAIQIIIGAGGNGAPADPQFGQGGGHTRFGPEVGSAAQSWLLGGGGQGGTWANNPVAALGGAGMIPGGNGDAGMGPDGSGIGAGNSTSAFSLNGGGGGGGRGFCAGRGPGSTGGSGGISPGGPAATPVGGTGSSPSEIVATGGGGGGGGGSGNNGGGTGGYPGGGGGGAACQAGGAGHGGVGADGILYIIERMA